MGLTAEQKDLLRTVVGVYNSGCHSPFALVRTFGAPVSLLYSGRNPVTVDADELDFRALADEGLLALEASRSNALRGKPTQKGIDAVAADFGSPSAEDLKPGCVFISCGQYTACEKSLGREVAKLVERLTGHPAYFAENQNSLQGLKENIFTALSASCGFVAIMHDRGDVKTPDGTLIRASVWVEQEIAIAAFLAQMQSRDFPVAVYMQRGIAREGVRQLLHLNEIDFESPEQVLGDLKARITEGRFMLESRAHGVWLAIRIDYEVVVSLNEYHEYNLRIGLENIGDQPATDCSVRIEFPKDLIVRSNDVLAHAENSTKTHVVYRIAEPYPIFADGGHRDLYPFTYKMTDEYDEDSILDQQVIVSVTAKGMPIQRRAKTIRELTNY